MKPYDLIITGCGPAGASLALNLHGSGLRVAVLEKERFPREKICGDALSGHVVSELKRMPGPVWEAFSALEPKAPCGGIRFSAPNGRWVDLPFQSGSDGAFSRGGYLCRRSVFDHFLAEQVRLLPDTTLIEGFDVKRVGIEDNGVVVEGDGATLHAAMVAGADGGRSVVRGLLPDITGSREDLFLGIRAYYRNVAGLHPGGFIELHFLDPVLPGYLWIFPMAGGMANVGLGMRQQQVKRDRLALAPLMESLLTTAPSLKERFAGAERTGNIEAHTLPTGPHDGPLSGESFLLLGDAAGLVDPFTGEGIGNALMSGRLAAETIREAFGNGRFSPKALARYDLQVRGRIFPELRVNKRLQSLASRPGLINFVVNRVAKSTKLQALFSEMYTDAEARKRLSDPMFYLKMLVKG